MAITTGKVGSLQIIDTSTPFAAESMTEDGSTKIYQIDDTGMRMWDPNTTITISTGTLDATWMDGGVDWFTGRVKLTATGLSVTVTGEYVSLQTVTEISGWSVSVALGTGETTEVGDTWATSLGLGKSVTLTLNRYRFDTLFDKLSGDELILIKLYEDADSGFWMQCLRSSIGYTKAVNAIDTDAISFVITAPISYFS